MNTSSFIAAIVPRRPLGAAAYSIGTICARGREFLRPLRIRVEDLDLDFLAGIGEVDAVRAVSVEVGDAATRDAALHATRLFGEFFERRDRFGERVGADGEEIRLRIAGFGASGQVADVGPAFFRHAEFEFGPRLFAGPVDRHFLFFGSFLESSGVDDLGRDGRFGGGAVVAATATAADHPDRDRDQRQSDQNCREAHLAAVLAHLLTPRELSDCIRPASLGYRVSGRYPGGKTPATGRKSIRIGRRIRLRPPCRVGGFRSFSGHSSRRSSP